MPTVALFLLFSRQDVQDLPFLWDCIWKWLPVTANSGVNLSKKHLSNWFSTVLGVSGWRKIQLRCGWYQPMSLCSLSGIKRERVRVLVIAFGCLFPGFQLSLSSLLFSHAVETLQIHKKHSLPSGPPSRKIQEELSVFSFLYLYCRPSPGHLSESHQPPSRTPHLPLTSLFLVSVTAKPQSSITFASHINPTSISVSSSLRLLAWSNSMHIVFLHVLPQDSYSIQSNLKTWSHRKPH